MARHRSEAGPAACAARIPLAISHPPSIRSPARSPAQCDAQTRRRCEQPAEILPHTAREVKHGLLIISGRLPLQSRLPGLGRVQISAELLDHPLETGEWDSNCVRATSAHLRHGGRHESLRRHHGSANTGEAELEDTYARSSDQLSPVNAKVRVPCIASVPACPGPVARSATAPTTWQRTPPFPGR